MNRTSIETTVGIFMLIGIACVGYLTIKLGRMELIGGNHYTVSAHFQSVSGLRTGASVEMAGVPVGRVESIALDQEREDARVLLKIENHIELTEDVLASVKTSGLIGDKFILLTLGSSDEMLSDGDEITETESAVDLQGLIGKYAFGGVE